MEGIGRGANNGSVLAAQEAGQLSPKVDFPTPEAPSVATAIRSLF